MYNAEIPRGPLEVSFIVNFMFTKEKSVPLKDLSPVLVRAMPSPRLLFRPAYVNILRRGLTTFTWVSICRRQANIRTPLPPLRSRHAP